MSRTVESSSCPTCGAKHSTGTVQRYEIPEIPVVEMKAVNELRKQIDDLDTAVKNIKFPEIKFPEVSLPEGFGDMCSKFPELCERVDKLEEQSSKTLDLISSHPKPTEQLEKVWEDCVECKDLWLHWKNKIGEEAATKAVEEYKKKQEEEKAKVEPKEASKPSEPPFLFMKKGGE